MRNLNAKYDRQKKENAIRMLLGLIELISNDTYRVDMFGSYPMLTDKNLRFHIDVTEIKISDEEQDLN